MAPQALYLLCVFGAIGVYLLLRPGSRALKGLGAIIGLAALAGMLNTGVQAFGSDGGGVRPDVFYVIFSLIAIASAVRMVTHPRPVYCALYFVMVVISSAALFLLLEAEFLTFALVIVYAGAILITYLFVLMLAQQSPSEEAAGGAAYDVTPREPLVAVLVGFIMLALLTQVVFGGVSQLGRERTAAIAAVEAWRELELMPRRLQEEVLKQEPRFVGVPVTDEHGRRVRMDGEGAFVVGSVEGSSVLATVRLPEEAMPQNTERVGMALVAKFPASLEIAGVILLMAMFGAVVLARRQIELGEDEKRQAAGMRPLPGDHSDPLETSQGGAS